MYGRNRVSSWPPSCLEHLCLSSYRTNAPWGLARVCQTNKLDGSESSLTYSYTYDDTAGKGVDIYVLDAGIYTDHVSQTGDFSTALQPTYAAYSTTLRGEQAGESLF